MNDPGTYQIPAEFLRTPRSETAEPVYASDSETEEVSAQPAPERLDVHTATSEIGYLGDWVVHERSKKVGQVDAEIGFSGLWRKLGGVRETTKSLMSKEARISSELFADKRSNIFFFDKIGEGHGEWVINKYDKETDDFITVYYEVEAGDDMQEGRILVKWPDMPYRNAEPEEVEKLHKITSRYYELITSRLYR